MDMHKGVNGGKIHVMVYSNYFVVRQVSLFGV